MESSAEGACENELALMDGTQNLNKSGGQASGDLNEGRIPHGLPSGCDALSTAQRIHSACDALGREPHEVGAHALAIAVDDRVGGAAPEKRRRGFG